MVFTSISLAIGSIADIRTMGRISAKTLFWFLLCSFLALLLAGCVGYGTYSMGLFNTHIEGLAEASGSTGSNPLNVVLNIIPPTSSLPLAAMALCFPACSWQWPSA